MTFPSIRFVPLLVLVLGSAACGGDGEPGLAPDDAGDPGDRASKDDVATMSDSATSAEGSDGAKGTDTPVGMDSGGPGDGALGTDAGNRGDSALDTDAGNRGDSATDTEAGNRGDGAIDTDASGGSDARLDAAGEAGDARIDGGIAPCMGAVDTAFLREKLSKLSGALPVQIGGMDVTISERNSAPNKARARQFLTAEYQALGFTVTEHTYATGVNLIANKAGADAKFLILSAHYDSISNTVAGADDDGSGVIAGLATAKSLQNCQLAHGLRIVAFDEEEKGLVGSRAYVGQLPSTELADLIGDIQLEMLGYHTKQDGGFLLVDCRSTEGDRPESKFLNDAVLSAIASANLALKPYDACTTSSDHSPFWTAGKPAIVYSAEFFFSGADQTPCYHKECDKIDKINFDYYTKLTTLSVTVTGNLVGAH